MVLRLHFLACLPLLALLAVACGDDGTGGGGEGGAGSAGGPTAGGNDPSGGGPMGGNGTGGEPPVGSCGDVPTFADGLSPTEELFVAPNGDDQAGDGSAGNPFATIERAAADAAPGSAIRLQAGSYGGDTYLEGLSGTAEAPIWIGGVPGGERPILEGGGEALHLSRARYLIIHDLEVRNMSANGINADDGGDVDDPEASHHLLFDRLWIHDIGSGGNQDCLKLSGINEFAVTSSEMTVCGGGGSGSAIDHVGCHDGVIARNHFHDLGGSGVQCKGGSADIDIRWNRFVQAGERPLNLGGSTGFEFFRPPLGGGENYEAIRIRAVGNIIVGGTCAAAFVGCVDCELSANTIVDPDQWLFRILQETTSGNGFSFAPARNGLVHSNIFFFNRGELSGEDINVGGGTEPATFSLGSNLWFAHDNPGSSAPATPPAPDQSSVVGQDPSFAGANDYHIGPSSPAVGAGTVVSDLAGDFDGECYARPPAAGAYEARSR